MATGTIRWSDQKYTSSDLSDEVYKNGVPRYIKLNTQAADDATNVEPFIPGDTFELVGLCQKDAVMGEYMTGLPGIHVAPETIYIPLNYHGRVKRLARSEFTMPRVWDLVKCFPKFARAAYEPDSSSGEVKLLSRGEIIELVRTEGRSLIVRKPGEKTEINLPFNYRGDFEEVPEEKSYLLKDIMRECRCPMWVVFRDRPMLKTDMIPLFNGFKGELKLNWVFDQQIIIYKKLTDDLEQLRAGEIKALTIPLRSDDKRISYVISDRVPYKTVRKDLELITKSNIDDLASVNRSSSCWIRPFQGSISGCLETDDPPYCEVIDDSPPPTPPARPPKPDSKKDSSVTQRNHPPKPAVSKKPVSPVSKPTSHPGLESPGGTLPPSTRKDSSSSIARLGAPPPPPPPPRQRSSSPIRNNNTHTNTLPKKPKPPATKPKPIVKPKPLSQTSPHPIPAPRKLTPTNLESPVQLNTCNPIPKPPRVTGSLPDKPNVVVSLPDKPSTLLQEATDMKNVYENKIPEIRKSHPTPESIDDILRDVKLSVDQDSNNYIEPNAGVDQEQTHHKYSHPKPPRMPTSFGHLDLDAPVTLDRIVVPETTSGYLDMTGSTGSLQEKSSNQDLVELSGLQNGEGDVMAVSDLSQCQSTKQISGRRRPPPIPVSPKPIIRPHLNGTSVEGKQQPDTKDLPGGLKSLSVRDLVNILRKLKLEKLADLCEENYVDGDFLHDITELELTKTPYNLNSLDLRKVLRLKAGKLPNM